VAGFGIGATQVVFSNAAQAVLPQLVPAELLAKANGRLQVSLTVGETFAGPPLGSVLFAALRALPFGAGAGAFAGSALLLSGLPRVPGQEAERVPMRSSIAAGLRYLLRHRLLRTLALLLGVMNFSSQLGFAVLVLFAKQTLHTGTSGYGLLFTASAVGAIIGGFANPVITARLGMVPSLILAMVAQAAVLAGVGLAPNAFVAGGAMFLEGLLVTMWNVVTVSLRQQIVPAEMMGRVNSVYRLIGWGLIPVGAAAGGLIAHAVGLRAPFLTGAVLSAAALLLALPALLRPRP
jgi:predicted MFS family arabinose efflux permease